MNKNYSNVTLKEKAIFLFDLAHHLIFHKAASQKSIKNYFPAFLKIIYFQFSVGFGDLL